MDPIKSVVRDEDAEEARQALVAMLGIEPGTPVIFDLVSQDEAIFRSGIYSYICGRTVYVKLPQR